MRKSRVLWSGAALAAFAYLSVMVITGALPQQRQLVRAEAGGIMTIVPERVTRVELEARGKTLAFAREGSGWKREPGGALPQPLAEKLSMAVQVMHTSAPVRVMEPGEFQGTAPSEFGLDRPTISIALFEGPAPVLRARLGGLNPEKYLRYMAVEGRRELFLMSLFIGDMWQAVADDPKATHD